MEGFVFGIDVPASPRPGTDPAGEARRAEDLGYDFVSVNDHPGGTPSFEAWTTLAWMAARTSRIKVAPRVLGVPFRSPVLLAKMAETLQRLSGGRLILGLGGGSSGEELAAFGRGDLSPKEKIDGLEDALRILRGLWSGEALTFEGRRSRAVGARLDPAPGWPLPVWLGTYGPRGLRLVGTLADGWIPSLGLVPPDRVPVLRATILEAARTAGRSSEDLRFVYNLEVRVGPDRSPDPDVVSGSAGAVAERLIGFARLGFGGVNVIPVGPDEDEQRERFAREVIPEVRAALAGA